jgi:hypothetical protein
MKALEMQLIKLKLFDSLVLLAKVVPNRLNNNEMLPTRLYFILIG